MRGSRSFVSGSLVIAVLILGYTAPSFSEGKVKKGHCCIDGKVERKTQRACSKAKGSYFTAEAEAEEACSKPPELVPALKPLAPAVKPLAPALKPAPSPVPAPVPRKRPAAMPLPPKPAPVEPGFGTPPVKRMERAPSGFGPRGMQSDPPPPQPGPPGPDGPTLVDLAITEISFTPSSPKIGDSLMITAKVKNVGLMPSTTDAYFQLSLTDDPYTQYMRWVIPQFTETISNLAPGEERTITKSFTITVILGYGNGQQITVMPGDYKLHGIINTSAFQPGEENNAGNNELIKRFVIRDPAPSDLFLDNISLSSSCRIKIKFHNSGSPVPNADFNRAVVSVEEEDGHREQLTLSEVDPIGKSKQSGNWWDLMPTYIQFLWPANHPNPTLAIGLAPGQTSRVEVTLDPYHRIKDSRWGNNAMTKTLTCPQ